MKKIRKQFSKSKIALYWCDFLVDISKFDSLEDLEDCCFACGWESPLEKAHIISLDKGGSDSISNIHLLCPDCHIASENLSAKDYWSWFRKRNMMSLINQVISYTK